jgi:hypothetical protein
MFGNLDIEYQGFLVCRLTFPGSYSLILVLLTPQRIESQVQGVVISVDSAQKYYAYRGKTNYEPTSFPYTHLDDVTSVLMFTSMVICLNLFLRMGSMFYKPNSLFPDCCTKASRG